MHKWKETGVVREFIGMVDAIQVLNSNLELHQHKRFDDIHYVINDFTGISDVAITAEETKAFATSDEMVSLTKGELKIAIVIGNNFRPLAQAYQQQMIDSSFVCQIFETMADAQQWCLNPE